MTLFRHGGRAKRHDGRVRAFTAKRYPRSAGCDNTGLSGRWDFTLNWTPDETQFRGMGMKAPPLFTAIQEQLGLKLEAEKVDAPVMLVDHVEHPSPN